MENHTPYNLIFMDVQMPNLDGLQSTRLIRQAGYEAPIVALTAYAEESNVRECLDSGMDYFLAKPIRRPQLKHVLKTYCAPIPEEEEGETTPPPLATSTRPAVPPIATVDTAPTTVIVPTTTPTDGASNSPTISPKSQPTDANRPPA